MYQKASEKMKETMKANIALVESIRISSISNKKLQSDNKSGHTVLPLKTINGWLEYVYLE